MSSDLPRRRNVEDFIVVWIGEADDTGNSIATQLCRVASSTQTFSDAERCADYIRDAKNEKIFLVVSNSLAQKVLSELHGLPQLDSIYVVSSNTPSEHEEYSTMYAKVKGVFPEASALCEHLRQDIRVAEANTTLMSILSSNDVSPRDLNSLDPSFMYSQLFKEILLEFDYDEQARRQLVELCREQYAGNGGELNVIDEFDHDYQNHSPAWWYTRECFLYKMLNKALRTQNIDILCTMGVFIRDLHRQLEQLHSVASTNNTPLVLYRGQG
ncbi:unnamed protein product [Didymodactylos carnosus]|nr:unnamed protein product [Didymodactylos carnosus]CAF3950921.1 unnamed protein product [Didymodactylos carnosus]